MATTTELNNAYDENSRQAQINQIYDAQKQSKLSELENAYQQSKSNYEADAAKIPETYQTQKNDLAAQYERQKQAFNQNAAISGINTGTASQANLAMNNEYQRNYNTLGTAQANAQTEANRTLANLEATYKNNVATAIAENDYNRAAALMSAYESDKADAENTAKLKASYGDFSGYEALYGADTANNMRSVWTAQNPDLAYNTGNISAQDYYSMTGKYPAGYTQPQTYTPTAYNTFKSEVAAMKANGESAENINTALVKAVKAGDITAQEARQLMITY